VSSLAGTIGSDPGAVGNVTIGAGSSWTMTTLLDISSNLGTGILTLDGGSVNVPSVAVSDTGTIQGSGTISGSVTSSGTIRPGEAGTGILSIGGAYTQDLTGSLFVDIAGPNPGTGYDAVNAGGLVTLAGSLTVALANGYDPSGQSFEIVTGSAVVGTFTTATLPPDMTSEYLPDRVVIHGPPGGGCPADLDGDGDADAGDFFLYLDLFVACDPNGACEADLDGDGDADAGDFFAYLDLFVAGCG
ncbi:MAG: hypothetical protein D6685_05755, partial [Bacteroidetes bacterium]